MCNIYFIFLIAGYFFNLHKFEVLFLSPLAVLE